MQCPNCGASHEGDFCNQCGQSNVDLHLPIGELVREAAEEALGFDSRLRHTLVPFFFKPGELTRDYLSGRRVRYTSPLKLYLIASVLFFFAAAQRPAEGLVHIDTTTTTTSTDSPDAGLAQGLAKGIEDASPAKPEQEAKERNRVEKVVNERLRVLEAKGAPEASREAAGEMISILPKAMIVLLPLFAWLLKILWRGRFYAEHLIFALHYHAFAMLILIPGSLASGTASSVLMAIALIFTVVYLFLALRRVYGDGFWRTLFKLFALEVSYSFLLGLGIAVTAIVSIFML